MTKLVIISVPTNDKHYVVQSNNDDQWILVGEVAISGSIVGIGDSYEDARAIYNTLK